MSQDSVDTPQERTASMALRLRWLALLLGVAFFIAIRMLPLEGIKTDFREWIGSLGAWGPVVFVLVYILATVLFVPGTMMTLIAGGIYGLGIGFLIVSVGSTIGAALAFLIARYAARNRVAAMADGNRHFSAMDRAIAQGGWRIVALLRLSPAIPFNLQNYLYGLTPIRFWPCIFTSWIAMIPGTFLYVYLGHVTGAALDPDRKRSLAEWCVIAVGLLATLAVTIYVTRLAKRALNEQSAFASRQ